MPAGRCRYCDRTNAGCECAWHFFCIRQIKGFPCGGAIFLDDFMCGASNRWAAAFELPGRFIVEKRRQSKGL
ncbi:hypothetical protein X963_5363 [Burkholderia pseudomallei MSHR7498]|nr:hypothetical protein X948_5443 [Burkholderia pseudomallei MSHR5608]KGS75348.1 hypothetical protein X942_5255 [Burkholderia pseudomallei MSHR5596]KGS92306.1 hypothetical protein X963_5363 [Burkholderia pseudomallei MSHR7498]KGX48123.1 hypothetical protein Y600_5808 [Burkholderia pseudomallei MSHR3709]